MRAPAALALVAAALLLGGPCCDGRNPGPTWAGLHHHHKQRPTPPPPPPPPGPPSGPDGVAVPVAPRLPEAPHPVEVMVVAGAAERDATLETVASIRRHSPGANLTVVCIDKAACEAFRGVQGFRLEDVSALFYSLPRLVHRTGAVQPHARIAAVARSVESGVDVLHVEPGGLWAADVLSALTDVRGDVLLTHGDKGKERPVHFDFGPPTAGTQLMFARASKRTHAWLVHVVGAMGAELSDEPGPLDGQAVLNEVLERDGLHLATKGAPHDSSIRNTWGCPGEGRREPVTVTLRPTTLWTWSSPPPPPSPPPLPPIFEYRSSNLRRPPPAPLAPTAPPPMPTLPPPAPPAVHTYPLQVTFLPKSRFSKVCREDLDMGGLLSLCTPPPPPPPSGEEPTLLFTACPADPSVAWKSRDIAKYLGGAELGQIDLRVHADPGRARERPELVGRLEHFRKELELKAEEIKADLGPGAGALLASFLPAGKESEAYMLSKLAALFPGGEEGAAGRGARAEPSPNSNFVVSFHGTSTTAGHDCLASEAYPAVFHALLHGVFHRVTGRELEVRNAGMGNARAAPAALCAGAYLGDDTDIAVWDFALAAGEGGGGGGKEAPPNLVRNAETWIRTVARLPRRPAMVLLDSTPEYPPPAAPRKCKKGKKCPPPRAPPAPDWQRNFSWAPSPPKGKGKGAEARGSLLVEYRGFGLFTQSISEAVQGAAPHPGWGQHEMMVEGKQSYEETETPACRCPEGVATAPSFDIPPPLSPAPRSVGVSSWNLAPKGHSLRAKILAHSFLTLMARAVEVLEDAGRRGGGHVAALGLHPPPLPAPLACEPEVCGASMGCLTSFEPRGAAGRVAPPRGFVAEGRGGHDLRDAVAGLENSGWRIQVYGPDEISEREVDALGLGYRDKKLVLQAPAPTPPLVLRVPPTRRGRLFLCQPPGIAGLLPRGALAIDEVLDATYNGRALTWEDPPWYYRMALDTMACKTFVEPVDSKEKSALELRWRERAEVELGEVGYQTLSAGEGYVAISAVVYATHEEGGGRGLARSHRG